MIIRTPDGRYTFAIETEGEGDGNSVVYDRMVPVWDRFSYEASLGGENPPPSPSPQPDPPSPQPRPQPPSSSSGDDFPVTDCHLIQVTNEQDGRIPARMMSYWANAWMDGASIVMFCGHEDGRPRFFRVDPQTSRVERLGDLGIPYRGETEGWYWGGVDGALYVFEGPRFHRLYPFRGEDELLYDISADPRFKDCVLWQPHSSPSGRTHSATVQRRVSDGPYPNIGTVVFHDGVLDYFEAHGTLDESHLIGDNWIDIHETPEGQKGEDNRIIHLRTRVTDLIKDADRAMGHSDAGSDWMVGEADKPDPGMCGWWDLTQPLTPGRFHPLFPTLNMGYVAVRGTRILHSGDTQLRLIDRDSGSIQTLFDHGGGSAYDTRVKANLSPCGRVICFMSAFGGPRQDVWIAVLT